MEKCWICGGIANSKEHKFKASDIKRAFGKKFDAFLFNGDEVQEFNSYKDDIIQFPKVICVDCNNNKTRKHDNAYDEFVIYAYKNQKKILRERKIDFQDVYGEELWLENWNSRLNIIRPVSGQLLELQKMSKQVLEYPDMTAESVGLFIIYACNLNT